MDPNQPRLFILMRSDMKSLNPGKAMAQAAHAGTLFVHDMYKAYGKYIIGNVDINEPEPSLVRPFCTWFVGGFGTKIVLDCYGEETLKKAIDEACTNNYKANSVLDQTYPVRDGAVIHYIPVVTCGYIFDHDGELRKRNPYMDAMSLYK